MGTNIAGVVDWATNMPFVDLFKASRPWISGSDKLWDDKRALDLDENGWVRSLKPGQRARTLILTNKRHRGGTFVLLHDGEGEIDLEYSMKVVEGRSRPGRYVFQVAKNEQIGFAITKTNPRNPIRNIRVLAPGGSCEADDMRWCDASHPCPSGACLPFEDTYQERVFHPKFLATMTRYAVLRFMNWMIPRKDAHRVWAERPKVTDARWRGKGVPIEIMVALARRVRAEPWFTIPHQVDDDYVASFAAQVRDTLPEEFRVWVEHSNEVWNAQFPQHAAVAKCQAGKSQEGQYGAAIVCHAERSDAIFAVWHSAFGESADRVVRVLGSQAASAWGSELALSHRDLHERVDAVAIAPYFGLVAKWDNESEIARMSFSELLARTENELLPKAIEQMRQQAEVAKRFDVDLVAYEGGQHFVGFGEAENNKKINTLYDAINRHPQMKDLYLRYFAAWREAGGQLFVNFTDCDRYTKFGRWGILEYIDQPRAKAPKFQAVMEFIDENPRWW